MCLCILHILDACAAPSALCGLARILPFGRPTGVRFPFARSMVLTLPFISTNAGDLTPCIRLNGYSYTHAHLRLEAELIRLQVSRHSILRTATPTRSPP